jgi:N-acetylglutamate synthase-like GNAT family acetyltransferase
MPDLPPHMTNDFLIRPATEGDQPTIRAIVRAANINPIGLHWQRFLVAEHPDSPGKIIGIGQIKSHRDGSRELASIAVIPEWQNQGIASQIINTLLVKETSESGPLHLMCQQHMASFYTRFGFRQITRDEMPPYFRRMARIAGVFAPFVSSDSRLAVMRREASTG